MPCIRNQCSRVNWLFRLLAGPCHPQLGLASSGEGLGWARKTTHLAFWEVASAEGSFHPLAVSRKHLEKTKGAEKGRSQRAGSDLEREGFEELGGSVGRGRAGETHFFTGIFPSGLSCILSFTRLVGRKVAYQGPGAGTWSPHADVRHTEAGHTGTYILSKKVLREALAVSGCLTRASTSSAQLCRTPEHSSETPLATHGCPHPLQPRPVLQEPRATPGTQPQACAAHLPTHPPAHLAHILLIGDEVVEGEVYHVRARHHSECLEEEVVGEVHVEDVPELLALQEAETQ